MKPILCRGSLLLSVAMLATGCWEQTLEERVVVEIHADGSFGVRAETQLNAPDNDDKHIAANQRVEQRSREIVEGRDLWSYPFSRLEAGEEKFGWEKSGGALRRSVHSALVEDPQQLSPVLRACGAGLRVTKADQRGRLEIFPLSQSRASGKERRDVEIELKPWADAVADYGQSVTALFRYVEKHPDRAEPIFGRVFFDHLSESRRAALPEPTEAESELIDSFNDTRGQVMSFATLAAGQPETLNERVMAAFSPLCGEIAVELPVAALTLEGFVEKNGLPTIPPIDLYSALMSGRLTPVTPDPLLTLLERDRYRPPTEFELAPWLAQARVVRRNLSGFDVLDRLRTDLQPASIYRLEWMLPASAAPGSSTTEEPR